MILGSSISTTKAAILNDAITIQHKSGPDIISDGIAMGSIQVPGDGMPIVMMADRQTTGGYAKIATVITPDLWIIAQAKPGNSIRFSSVSWGQANKICVNTKTRCGCCRRG